jgi:hypothetical protein
MSMVRARQFIGYNSYFCSLEELSQSKYYTCCTYVLIHNHLERALVISFSISPYISHSHIWFIAFRCTGTQSS